MGTVNREDESGKVYVPALDSTARALIARIQRDHTDVEAVRSLERHYESKGDLPSLANLMEGWSGTLSDPVESADAMVKAGEAVLAGLGDRPRAWRLFDRALSRCPGHRGAIQHLVDLAQSPAELDVLASTLEHVASRLERARAAHAQRAQIHLRLATIYDSGLDNPSRAIAHYRKALELDRALTPAMAGARRIYHTRGKSRSVAILYEMEIGVTTDPEHKRVLMCELASVYRHDLDRLDDAVVTLRRALKAVPDHELTLQALADAVAQRAEEGPPGTRKADHERAAELYYQVARRVPRGEAPPFLERSLRHADHARARAMLRELEGHGNSDSGRPSYEARPQRELDAKQTLPVPAVDLLEAEARAAQERANRATTPSPIEPVVAGMNEVPEAPEPARDSDRPRPSDAPPEIKDWLANDDWVLDADQLRSEDLVPITEYPPAPATATRAPTVPPPPRIPSSSPIDPVDAPPSARTGSVPADVVDDVLLDPGDRAPVEVELSPDSVSNLFTGFAGDLRHGGVYVETYQALPLGTEVELLITLPGGFEARALGQVDFIKDQVDGDGGCGMGVRFQRLTVDDLELIARFAEKRAPLFF